MYKVNDKSKNVRQLNNYMLSKSIGMFRYKGLPDTIPQNELEKLLMTRGYTFFTVINGVPYVFWGGLGGEPDVYGNPTEINIANPALKLTKTFKLDEGVLIKNDAVMMGLSPLFERFNTLMVENQITLEMFSFNARATLLMSASDDRTKESAEQFLKKLRNGENAVIGENAIFDGLKSHSGNSSRGGTSLVHLIEYQQYLKAALYNEIGISAPSNMKRERLNSGEVNQQEDSLLILVDSMLQCRKDAMEKVREKFGIKISVDFDGVWKRKDEKENQGNIILPSSPSNPRQDQAGNQEEPEDE